jgi:hypothetical protein
MYYTASIEDGKSYNQEEAIMAHEKSVHVRKVDGGFVVDTQVVPGIEGMKVNQPAVVQHKSYVREDFTSAVELLTEFFKNKEEV